MAYIDQFAWQMRHVPGVLSALLRSASCGKQAYARATTRATRRWGVLPRDRTIRCASRRPDRARAGLLNPGCTVLPVHIYLTDHKATTIKGVIDAVKAFRERETREADVRLRLASGNAGVQAAVNEGGDTPSCR
jgi:hypothetical protein